MVMMMMWERVSISFANTCILFRFIFYPNHDACAYIRWTFNRQPTPSGLWLQKVVCTQWTPSRSSFLLSLFFCYIRKEKLAIQSTLKLFELMLSSTVYNGCTANTHTKCEPVPLTNECDRRATKTQTNSHIRRGNYLQAHEWCEGVAICIPSILFFFLVSYQGNVGVVSHHPCPTGVSVCCKTSTRVCSYLSIPTQRLTTHLSYLV